MKQTLLTALVTSCFLSSCTSSNKQTAEVAPAPQQVQLETTQGTIVLELSDRTPLHRDNFIKQVKEGAYDSLLFHRVIEGFVVQGGDPDSKLANPGDTLGRGGPDYTIPAEFDTTLFHKRGAVGTARNNNPERASNAMQFYIVQANTPLVEDSVFIKAETRINGWLRNHYHLQAPENKIWLDSLNQALENKDWKTRRAIYDTLQVLSEAFVDFERYAIPEAHRQVYREIGGTPFLDQNYTVFGQVISGMEIVDTIAAMPTDSLDRPVKDVRILSARMVESKE